MERNKTWEASVRVLIVDDEEESRNLLERLLCRLPGIEVVGKAKSADEAIEQVLNCQPDLIFLDVQMPEKSGFHLVEYLRKYLLEQKVVFVTAHADFAINALKVSAFDYLLKPVIMNELSDTLLRFKAERVRAWNQKKTEQIQIKSGHPDKIKFNTRTGYILVSPNDVMYCKADVNYTDIYYSTNKRETITLNLGKLEEIFTPYSFYRISRSILINKNYLAKADRQKKNCVLYKDGESITLEIPPCHIRELERIIELDS
jgi:two-component system LytT family response regulator